MKKNHILKDKSAPIIKNIIIRVFNNLNIIYIKQSKFQQILFLNYPDFLTTLYIWYNNNNIKWELIKTTNMIFPIDTIVFNQQESQKDNQSIIKNSFRLNFKL